MVLGLTVLSFLGAIAAGLPTLAVSVLLGASFLADGWAAQQAPLVWLFWGLVVVLRLRTWRLESI